MTITRFIHVTANAIILSFLWLSSIPLLPPIFFIHSYVNGHIGCFHVLAIVNSAAMNIGLHVSLQISFLQIFAQECDCMMIW